MGFVQKITDFIDSHPSLQCAWFILGCAFLLLPSFVAELALAVKDIVQDLRDDVVTSWREMRRDQRDRRPDDDDDDFPDYFAVGT